MSALPRTTLVLAVAILGAVCWAALPSGPTAPRPVAAQPPAAEYRVSGPFTHDNLTVFLLHGPDTLPPRPILTLDEALAKGTFVVHETGEVNTLVVENTSADDDVLIQPGDIVKGGKQDRLIASAVLVPSSAGRVAVPSFCVEQGRWTQRGNEAAGRFAENREAIAGRDLKQAALVDGQQSAVWANVQLLQGKLAHNVGKPVANAQSPTSLQLALEDGAVREKLGGYERELAGVLRGSKGVVGYVTAVNGAITGAEVYGSAAVMTKAWPKALRSAAVEALAEQGGKVASPPTAAEALAFLADAEKGQKEQGPGEQIERALAGQVAGIADVNRDTPVSQNPLPGNRNPNAAQGQAALRQTTAQPQPAGRGWVDVGGRVPRAAPAAVQVNRVSGANAVLVESRDAANPGVVIHKTFVAKK